MRVEKISKYNLDLILPVLLVVLAELLIFLGYMRAALAVHSINLILLILSSAYIENRIFPALMLMPLFRLLNIAMPVFFQLTLYSYPLVYAPMFLPIYLLLKERMFSWSEAGITVKGFWFFLPLALAVGFALGWGEYQVLRPSVLVPDFSLRSVLTLSLTMIFFVGFVEEFVFRSALQTVMEERMGSIMGLVIASVLFGFMHSGYHLPLELLYVSFAGVVFGLLFWVTKSLPVIALAHGITNVSLFLVTPTFSDLIIYLVGISGIIFVIIASFYRRLPGKGISLRN